LCNILSHPDNQSFCEGGISMKNLHFSQGDGEITFCGAIEMAGYLDIRVS
jgi:formamidase|tara:strand:- start:6908 stop:7057 length:150 start_codon:yes stop_codon:yes gene_type:complete